MNANRGERPDVGVVHLGIGAFFRAFGLPALQEMMAITNPDRGGEWGVVGVSLRNPTSARRLETQRLHLPCGRARTWGPKGDPDCGASLRLLSR